MFCILPCQFEFFRGCLRCCSSCCSLRCCSYTSRIPATPLFWIMKCGCWGKMVWGDIAGMCSSNPMGTGIRLLTHGLSLQIILDIVQDGSCALSFARAENSSCRRVSVSWASEVVGRFLPIVRTKANCVDHKLSQEFRRGLRSARLRFVS